MKPTHIILHHSLTKDSKTVSKQAIERYHVNTLKYKKGGYHFYIEDINGTIEVIVGRYLTEDGAHCKQQGMNQYSIGICIVGNFDLTSPSREIWLKTVDFTRSLCTSLTIPTMNIRAHRHFANYKTCPGDKWNMDKFRHDVIFGLI